MTILHRVDKQPTRTTVPTQQHETCSVTGPTRQQTLQNKTDTSVVV